MIRHVTGWLWQFIWFRQFFIFYIRFGCFGHGWLAVNTPFAISMRAYFVRLGGHYEQIAAIDKLLHAYRDTLQ